ncbi:MAG: N-acetyltransferase [Chloroflexota bacterium]|nr:N-acetyltransferase [Chloroflexota bacterium]
MGQDQIDVAHNEAAGRFEAEVGGHLAVVEYKRAGNLIIFMHTEVPEELEGQGIASQLARTALEYAKAQQLDVLPLCAFVASYVRRHPEYEPLVSRG